MVKKKEKTNTLIKRKGIALWMQGRGIKRISPLAFPELERYIKNCLEDIAPVLAEELAINGRNILKKEDIAGVLEKIKSQNRNVYPEI